MDDKIDPCPHCNFELDDGDIYDYCLGKCKGDARQALKLAEDFGWTPTHPKRFSLRYGMYNPDLDRTDKFFCPSCHKRLPEKNDRSIQP